jgi:hypothetical protein
LKWIGVGRGRYGNLVLQQGETDEVYAKQIETIHKKWRAFGSTVKNKGEKVEMFGVMNLNEC